MIYANDISNKKKRKENGKSQTIRTSFTIFCRYFFRSESCQWNNMKCLRTEYEYIGIWKGKC